MTRPSPWIVVAAGVALACSSGGAGAVAAGGAIAAAQYRCPMHPSVVQDHPGDCPVCSMKLVPAPTPPPAAPRAQGAAHVEGAPLPRAAPSTSAAIAVAPEQQRLLGVTVHTVERGAARRTLRLPGRVTPDERRVYRVNAGIDGSIRGVAAATVGTRVRKDEVLATFWAPSALSTIQLFIANVGGKEYVLQRYAVASVEGQGVELAYANLQQRLMQLENMGVSAVQRAEIARTKKIPDTIQIVSPADGVVVARNVTPGMKFDRGAELYRIADLRRVWIVADVFPGDARHVRAGARATVSAPEQGVSLPATVAEILPQFDGTTRTLKVRLEVENPRLVLRPEMFVEVLLDARLPAGVAVPADAVVDSGLARVVFVESAAGVFEPRRVETGWRSDGRVEIVRGLEAGERVVASGTFFLDSESRLRPPASGAAVVTSTAPDPTAAARRNDGGAGSHPGAGEVPSPVAHAEDVR
jgi:Cu(I)/Ag(I) efflux system membrane fusion protein